MNPLVFHTSGQAFAQAALIRALAARMPIRVMESHNGMRDELKQLDPRAIIVSGWRKPVEWRCICAAHSLGIPIFLRGEATSLNLPRGCKRAILRRLCASAEAVLSIGTRCTEYYRAIGVPLEKIFLAPYAVNNDYFMRESARYGSAQAQILDRLGLDPGKPTILFVGKLIPRKRPNEVAKIAARLREQGQPCNVLFVGAGPMAKELRGNKDTVVTGWVRHEDISQYYAAADVFVFPSSFETWGLVVNEAMCFGLPVVSCPTVSSTRDLVEYGHNGYVCSPGAEMVAKVGRLLQDRGLRRSMGARSREKIMGWGLEHGAEGVMRAIGGITE